MDADDVKEVTEWLNTPGTIFISHTPPAEVFPDVNRHMDNAAQAAGFRREPLRVFSDRRGRPIFEVFRYIRS
jgi:hypothetical protein